MDDNCAFIIDQDILNEFNLLNSNGEDYHRGENAQLFFEYLSYRKCNKKAFMIPSLYRKICNQLRTDEGESLAYFKNWVDEGDIGESPDTTEEQDIISLYNTLNLLHEKVFIVSSKYDGNPNFKNLPVLNMENITKYLRDKSDFMNFIREHFFGECY